ncbi:MAG TPA: hypothetical protein VFG69_07110 [Nannocystaceae bacterium]|nr:hypothetical protein [Nannocystaceae bacterium]
MDRAFAARATVVRAWAAAAVGLGAVVATIAALWPALGVPAWPGASLGCGAAALALGPGPIAPKAVATLLGTGAATLGVGQIAMLWLAAGALP